MTHFIAINAIYGKRRLAVTRSVGIARIGLRDQGTCLLFKMLR